MKIKGFEKGKGDYFICRYVVGWKSGKYFHKEVCFETGKYENDKKTTKELDKYYQFALGTITWPLNCLGHNLEVVRQFETVEELNKAYQNYENYREY